MGGVEWGISVFYMYISEELIFFFTFFIVMGSIVQIDFSTYMLV